MVLEYKGYTFRHGDYIEGTIKGEPVSGHLNAKDSNVNNYYFCQDEIHGNMCSDTLGHTYSWVFSVDHDGNLLEQVELFIPENSKKDIKFTEDIFQKSFVEKSFSRESFKYNYYDRFKFSFSIKLLEYVDCYILEKVKLYNKLDTLKEDIKDKVITDLKISLARTNVSNLIINIENTGNNSNNLIRFLEDELNFYRCNVYRNRQSGGIVNCLTKNL